MTPNDIRRLATVETIVRIEPIPGADAIEVATVRGWKVVVRKGAFLAGQRVVYVEVDAMLDVSDPRFAFLAPHGVRSVTIGDGAGGRQVDVHVLRTAKLRGQISQGLVLTDVEAGIDVRDKEIGTDLTGLVTLGKYEPPIPAGLGGQIVGAFPTRLARKTDAERVQNLTGVFEALGAHPAGWTATQKVDGSSVTFIAEPRGDTIRVCSRNWELNPASPGLTSMVVAHRLMLPETMQAEADACGAPVVIQGELYGPGIQGNPEKVSQPSLAVFAHTVGGQPVVASDRRAFLTQYCAPELGLPFPGSVEAALTQVNGMRSVINPAVLAEGVVWHTADGAGLDVLEGRSCFKVISDKYLMKHGG